MLACCLLATAAFVLTACDRSATVTTLEQPESWPEVPLHFANLQVMPETIERDELISSMRTMSRSLGVRCGHCHATQTDDYASDEVDAKIIAREMMRLVDQFNALTNEREDATPVTCEMCHHGAVKPPPLVCGDPPAVECTQ